MRRSTSFSSCVGGSFFGVVMASGRPSVESKASVEELRSQTALVEADPSSCCEVSLEMINRGVEAYEQMALYDDRCWYTPSEIVRAVVMAALSAQSSQQSHSQVR